MKSFAELVVETGLLIEQVYILATNKNWENIRNICFTLFQISKEAVDNRDMNALLYINNIAKEFHKQAGFGPLSIPQDKVKLVEEFFYSTGDN